MSVDKATSPRIPALDGVRGVAILLVITCHISERFQFSNVYLQCIKAFAFAGWTGVDLFFVLSGFLITGILWDSRGSSTFFRNFYARRTIRIFPLYYATLAILFIFLPATTPNHVMTRGWLAALELAPSYWAWYFTYFVDVLIALKGFVVTGGHFWTLAVEEHFYLVWPVLVYKLSRRTLKSLSISLIVAALALRLAMVIYDVAPTAIYVLTPCRMDGLALGAFLALTVRDPNGLQTLVRLARLVLPASALIWLTLMCIQGEWSQYGIIPQTVGYLVTELFYGSVLVLTLASNRLAAVASARPLRFLGKISYALYVFHVFVVLLAAPFFALGDASHYSIVFALITRLGGELHAPGALLLLLDALVYVAVSVGVSIGIAVLSWYTLELPCLRLRCFFPYARKNAAENVLETSHAVRAY